MRAILALGLLGLASVAQAQGLGEPKLALSVTAEQAMLIVQTLEAIGCQSVKQLVVCQGAIELLHSIREQAKAQGK